jgi:hypothetical protein
MVDHAARADICATIDDFLNDRLSAFDFDEGLDNIRSRTEDRTAWFVIGTLWYFYDDCDDHLACLDKDTWNVIQRLKLVLQSGTEIETKRRRIWHVSQLIALTTLAAMAYVCSIDLKMWPLPVLAGGLVSLGLSKCRERLLRAYDVPDPWRAWPFASPSAIARALRRATDFKKQRHRSEVARRRIRTAADERVNGYLWLFGQCVLSPILLIGQCWPITIKSVVVTNNGQRLSDAA